MSAMWGGRFADGPDELFEQINNSLRFDWRLVRFDIESSKAWAGALVGAGVLSADESKRVCLALDEILVEAESLTEAPLESGAEDVHSWVEMRLTEKQGELGKKLHTGRSRNDQVATDLRMWMRQQCNDRINEIRAMQRVLVDLAAREFDAVMPGYTHLQRAQPILLAHWALAYFQMLQRDVQRLTQAQDSAYTCPLGAAALAGTAYQIDRSGLAEELGFSGPTANSLDAVSDRDFVLDGLWACVQCAVHLSKLAEECVIYSTQEFGFFTFNDDMTSGSSIMPQKKNPDAMELMRGKAGRIVGSLTGLLMTMKGLPLAYNKDLQEDKEPIFDAMDQLSICLRAGGHALSRVQIDKKKMRECACGGYANATEFADYLVYKGVAFRDAHTQVGQIVLKAIELGVNLEDLSLDLIRSISPCVDADVADWLTIESCLARRDVYGGTAPGRVQAALEEARKLVEQDCHN